MTILDIAIAYGLDPKRVASCNGGEYASPCPKCGGEDRFLIWPEQSTKIGQGTFWCRDTGNGCGWKGDSVEFLKEIKGMKFPEACEYIGHNLPPRSRQPIAPVQKKKNATDVSINKRSAGTLAASGDSFC